MPQQRPQRLLQKPADYSYKEKKRQPKQIEVFTVK